MSPTSPRTKQTPRKNTNPIRTTSLSPATQTSSQSAVPNVDAKVTSPRVMVSATEIKPTGSLTISSNATLMKPPIVNVAPPPKAFIPINATLSQIQPHQSIPIKKTNSAENKPNAAITPKKETAPVKLEAIGRVRIDAKPVKVDGTKNNDIKIEPKKEVIKAEDIKPVKMEKPIIISKYVPVAYTPMKLTESKIKQNATFSQNNTNQCALKEKDNKEKADQVTKTPIKAVKASQLSTPISNSTEVKVKRNRFKTIPYQSPTPEFELVSKISANEAINAQKKKVAKPKPDEDKLTLFYK